MWKSGNEPVVLVEPGRAQVRGVNRSGKYGRVRGVHQRLLRLKL